MHRAYKSVLTKDLSCFRALAATSGCLCPWRHRCWRSDVYLIWRQCRGEVMYDGVACHHAWMANWHADEVYCSAPSSGQHRRAVTREADMDCFLWRLSVQPRSLQNQKNSMIRSEHSPRRTFTPVESPLVPPLPHIWSGAPGRRPCPACQTINDWSSSAGS